MGDLQLYHVGIVVPDLVEARERLTELVGCAWGPTMAPTLEWRDGDGAIRATDLRMCFSDGPPYIELIEERPGTIWECNEHSNLHHIGFWSGAIAAESQRFTDARCPLQGTMADGSGAAGFAYHRDPLGFRLELIDETSRAGMEQHSFGRREA